MKHIKTFEKYQVNKRRYEIIKESVLQVNDIYKVRTMIDIPQSLINSYVKKVKDNTGKNLRQFFGDVDIAEEIVKFINLEFLNVDKIPSGFLTGDSQGQSQTQGQEEGQEEVQVQTQEEAQGQGQEEAQGQAQGQGEFEEVESEEEEEEGSEELPEGGSEEESEEEEI